jgi:tRNA A64-2'-O-ribosylphosphate transferase
MHKSILSYSVPVDWREKRERQKEINKIRNRLHSIEYDVEYFLKPCLKYVKAKSPVMKSWPLLANQRCGAWYTGSLTKSSCYFKSVDGHVGTWNFSLKRLNLEVFRSARKAGGCWIVDASRSKEMPDSFSRTIPIWAAVLNRIILRYRQEAGFQEISDWDRSLYTPTMISHEERNVVIALLDDRVEELFTSGVILQPNELTQLHKPLRPVWITEDTANNRDEMQHLDELAKNYCLIVCISCGLRSRLPKDLSFTYSSGAGDDDESWSRGLTPDIFWKKKSAILKLSTNDQVEALVDQLVLVAKDEDPSDDCSFHAIGESGIFIGTRRAGKPPECWECFDAILNVSMLEYEEMTSETPLPESCYYLQLPVEEGKRDKTELERWLAVGITFICCRLVQGQRVLVHCAQGRDRSVAVVLAAVVLFCNDDLTTLRSKLKMHGILDFVARWSQESNSSNTDGLFYKQSGLTRICVDSLMGRAGRDKLLGWCKESFGPSTTTSLATKATIRVALQMIQAHRPMASPSRKTLQKLSRFFMSDRTMYDS